MKFDETSPGFAHNSLAPSKGWLNRPFASSLNKFLKKEEIVVFSANAVRPPFVTEIDRVLESELAEDLYGMVFLSESLDGLTWKLSKLIENANLLPNLKALKFSSNHYSTYPIPLDSLLNKLPGLEYVYTNSNLSLSPVRHIGLKSLAFYQTSPTHLLDCVFSDLKHLTLTEDDEHLLPLFEHAPFPNLRAITLQQFPTRLSPELWQSRLVMQLEEIYFESIEYYIENLFEGFLNNHYPNLKFIKVSGGTFDEEGLIELQNIAEQTPIKIDISELRFEDW